MYTLNTQVYCAYGHYYNDIRANCSIFVICALHHTVTAILYYYARVFVRPATISIVLVARQLIQSYYRRTTRCLLQRVGSGPPRRNRAFRKGNYNNIIIIIIRSSVCFYFYFLFTPTYRSPSRVVTMRRVHIYIYTSGTRPKLAGNENRVNESADDFQRPIRDSLIDNVFFKCVSSYNIQSSTRGTTAAHSQCTFYGKNVSSAKRPSDKITRDEATRRPTLYTCACRSYYNMYIPTLLGPIN